MNDKSHVSLEQHVCLVCGTAFDTGAILLDKHEREPEEASPLGIILCTGKKREQIELLELDKSGIHVAEYLTALPPRGVLVERLQQATQRAQLQIEQRKTDNE